MDIRRTTRAATRQATQGAGAQRISRRSSPPGQGSRHLEAQVEISADACPSRPSKRLRQEGCAPPASVTIKGARLGSESHAGNSGDGPVATDGAAEGGPSLPSALMLHCLELLSPNELACSGRLAFKDAAQRFSSPAQCTAHLSQPLPAHIADSWPLFEGSATAALRHLTFRRKRRVLNTAAASGSETNMRIAWQLVQPCLFPELRYVKLCDQDYSYVQGFHAGSESSRNEPYLPGIDWQGSDPGTAAVRAGHVRLLRWMLKHGVPLSPNSTLQAAAQYCSLAELQEAAELLQQHRGHVWNNDIWGKPRFDEVLWDCVTKFAAASRTPDAQAKVEWLLRHPAANPGADKPGTALAVSAARASNLDLLQWLKEQQCSVTDSRVLDVAVQHAASLEVANWLLDEAGCRLPANRNPDSGILCSPGSWANLSRSAAASGSMETIQWLAARAGAPLHVTAASAAAHHGHLEVLQHLHAQRGVALSENLFYAAVGSGNMELVAWLRDEGCDMRCPMHSSPYRIAAEQGNLGLVQWLAQEARCPGLDEPKLATWVVKDWGLVEGPRGRVTGTQGASGGAGAAGATRAGGGVGAAAAGDGVGSTRLAAVRTLVAAGCSLGDDGLLDDAASVGDLGLVQYLHEQGMPFSGDTLMCAAGSGCEALVEWLVSEKGCRAGPRVESDPYLEAGERCNRSMLTFLTELGVRWNRRVLMAAVNRRCKLPVVQWMVQHGAPAGRDELHSAISMVRGQKTEVTTWLEQWRDEAMRRKKGADVGAEKGQKGKGKGQGQGAKGTGGRSTGGKKGKGR